MLSIFHLLQYEMVLGILNPFQFVNIQCRLQRKVARLQCLSYQRTLTQDSTL